MVNLRILPSLLCLLIFGLGAYCLSDNLATGRSLHYDEFYSLERSHGFIKHRDWLHVYSANEPTAKKPPLQDWLNAAVRKAGASALLALRIWSYLFFLGTIVVCSLFVYSITRGNAWAVAACQLMLLSSTTMVSLSRSGLLDSGMAFFMLCVLYALYLTRANTTAWIACGVFVGLGALQKAPVGLLFAVFIIYLLHAFGEPGFQWSNLRKNSQFNVGFHIAFGMLLTWPIAQSLTIGPQYFATAVTNEMLLRFSPSARQFNENSLSFDWVEWFWQDLHLLSILAAICVLLAIGMKRLRGDRFFFALSLIIPITAISFSIAGGHIYPRYLAVFTPLSIIITARVLSEVFHKCRPAVLGVVVCLASFSISSIQTAWAAINRQDDVTRIVDIVSLLDSNRRSDDHVLFDARLLPPGGYGYYGKSNLPLFIYRFSNNTDVRRFRQFFEREGNTLSILGLVDAGDAKKIRAIVGDFQEITRESGYVMWRYSPKSTSSSSSSLQGGVPR